MNLPLCTSSVHIQVTEAFELGLAELPVLLLRQPAGCFSNPNAALEPETLRLLLHMVPGDRWHENQGVRASSYFRRRNTLDRLV